MGGGGGGGGVGGGEDRVSSNDGQMEDVCPEGVVGECPWAMCVEGDRVRVGVWETDPAVSPAADRGGWPASAGPSSDGSMDGREDSLENSSSEPMAGDVQWLGLMRPRIGSRRRVSSPSSGKEEFDRIPETRSLDDDLPAEGDAVVRCAPELLNENRGRPPEGDRDEGRPVPVDLDEDGTERDADAVTGNEEPDGGTVDSETGNGKEKELVAVSLY